MSLLTFPSQEPQSAEQGVSEQLHTVPAPLFGLLWCSRPALCQHTAPWREKGRSPAKGRRSAPAQEVAVPTPGPGAEQQAQAGGERAGETCPLHTRLAHCSHITLGKTIPNQGCSAPRQPLSPHPRQNQPHHRLCLCLCLAATATGWSREELQASGRSAAMKNHQWGEVQI